MKQQEDPTPEEIEQRKLTLPPRKRRKRGPAPVKNNLSRREMERPNLGCFDGIVRRNSPVE